MYDIQCIKEYAYYMSNVYSELDSLRYEAIGMDDNKVTDFIVNDWPVIQGSKNTRRIREISRIPYDPTNVLHGAEILNNEVSLTLWNELKLFKPGPDRSVLVWPGEKVVGWLNSFTHEDTYYREGFYGEHDTQPIDPEQCTHWMYVPDDPPL